MGAENSMWRFIGVALQTVALTGLVGTGVGVGYYIVRANEFEERNR
jgi:protein-S-isoprenylcysteine O-methyltransferase Ste14